MFWPKTKLSTYPKRSEVLGQLSPARGLSPVGKSRNCYPMLQNLSYLWKNNKNITIYQDILKVMRIFWQSVRYSICLCHDTPYTRSRWEVYNLSAVNRPFGVLHRYRGVSWWITKINHILYSILKIIIQNKCNNVLRSIKYRNICRFCIDFLYHTSFLPRLSL